MALTSDQISAAKEEAQEFLEYACYTIGLSLGVLPEEISPSMVIPVPETDPEYVSYVTLKRLASNLEKLQ